MDNEFDQRILLLRLEEFGVVVQYAKKFLKAQVTMVDFYVKDLWSGSKQFEHLAYFASVDSSSNQQNEGE